MFEQNVLISGFTKFGMVDVARSLFDEMPTRDLFTYSVMISGYTQSWKAEDALEVNNGGAGFG